MKVRMAILFSTKYWQTQNPVYGLQKLILVEQNFSSNVHNFKRDGNFTIIEINLKNIK